MSDLYEKLDTTDNIWDAGGKLLKAFQQCYFDYDDAPKEMMTLVREYDSCDQVTQGVINNVLTALCGYSLPSLVRSALHGREAIDDTEDFPFTVLGGDVLAQLDVDGGKCTTRIYRVVALD